MGIVGALTDVQPLSQASNEIFRSVIVTYSPHQGSSHEDTTTRPLLGHMAQTARQLDKPHLIVLCTSDSFAALLQSPATVTHQLHGQSSMSTC